MDRGRQIDNTQNVNARYIDNFGPNQKTSVRTTNPPGGKSSFSLGWSEPEPIVQKKTNNNNTYNNNESTNNNWKSIQNRNDNSQNVNDNNVNKIFKLFQNFNQSEKTSVKVKYAPGGQSQISFGSDQTNYDDFKKNSGAGLYKK